MILKSLGAIGFKSLQIERLEFAKGVTLIRGRNESGKSTLMEAVLFALYGLVIKPKANASSSDIIEYNAEEALVTLDFRVADQDYRVMRQISRGKGKASTGKLWRILPNGHLDSIQTHWNDTTDGIVALLGGVTYHEIVSSCIVAQKELGKLINQNPGKREEIINIFLDLNDFNKVEATLGERKKELLGPRGKGGILENEKTKLDSLTKDLGELKEKQETKRTTQKQLKTTKAELKSTRDMLSSKKPILDILVEYNDVRVKRETMKAKIEGLEEKAGVLEGQLNEFATTRTEMEEQRKQLDELSYLENSLPIVEEISTMISGAEEAHRSVGSKREILRDATDKLGGLESQRKDLAPSSEESAILSRPDVNTRRLRVLVIPMILLVILGLAINYVLLIPALLIGLYVALKSFQAINLQTLKAKASVKHAKYVSISELVGEQQQVIDGIQEEVHTLENLETSSMTKLSQLESELPDALTVGTVKEGPIAAGKKMVEKFREQEGKSRELSHGINQMERQLKKEPEIRKQAQDTREKARTLKEAYDDLRYPELPSGVEFTKDLLEERRTEVDELGKKVAKLEERIRGLDGVLTELETYLQEKKNIPDEVESQKEIVRNLEIELKTHNLAVEAITSTTGAARQRVKPSVESFMQQILPAITADRYRAVKLSDSYDVSVFVPERGEFVQKEVFSGGTEDQLLLATRIAFALSLLPRGKQTQPEFLFLDEPLGSSDEVRREGIMNLTRTILKDTFQQIFIISHVAGLEEWADSIVELEDGKVVSSG